MYKDIFYIESIEPTTKIFPISKNGMIYNEPFKYGRFHYYERYKLRDVSELLLIDVDSPSFKVAHEVMVWDEIFSTPLEDITTDEIATVFATSHVSSSESSVVFLKTPIEIRKIGCPPLPEYLFYNYLPASKITEIYGTNNANLFSHGLVNPNLADNYQLSIEVNLQGYDKLAHLSRLKFDLYSIDSPFKLKFDSNSVNL